MQGWLPTQGMSHQDHWEGQQRLQRRSWPPKAEKNVGHVSSPPLTRLETLHNEQVDQGRSKSWSPARLCTAAMGGSDVLRRQGNCSAVHDHWTSRRIVRQITQFIWRSPQYITFCIITLLSFRYKYFIKHFVSQSPSVFFLLSDWPKFKPVWSKWRSYFYVSISCRYYDNGNNSRISEDTLMELLIHAGIITIPSAQAISQQQKTSLNYHLGTVSGAGLAQSVQGMAAGRKTHAVGIRVSVLSRIFSSQCHPYPTWGPTGLLSNGNNGHSRRSKADGSVKLITHLQLLQRSRSGSIHPLSIRLHGAVLNWLRTGTTLSLPYRVYHKTNSNLNLSTVDTEQEYGGGGGGGGGSSRSI
jgi:hypothetical protein